VAHVKSEAGASTDPSKEMVTRSGGWWSWRGGQVVMTMDMAVFLALVVRASLTLFRGVPCRACRRLPQEPSVRL